MEPEFWNQRWTENQIGFHEGTPNAFLQQHAAKLGEKKTVLVPLCGKSADLTYLASLGHTVIGIELVEMAARAYFSERKITPIERGRDGFTILTSNGITIFVGDFFKFTRGMVPELNALFDRAAIIALPEEMRRRYSAHLKKLLAAGSPALMICSQYDQSKANGPPFSVLDAELDQHFPGVTRTVLGEIPLENKRLIDAGVTGIERCFSFSF